MISRLEEETGLVDIGSSRPLQQFNTILNNPQGKPDAQSPAVLTGGTLRSQPAFALLLQPYSSRIALQANQHRSSSGSCRAGFIVIMWWCKQGSLGLRSSAQCSVYTTVKECLSYMEMRLLTYGQARLAHRIRILYLRYPLNILPSRWFMNSLQLCPKFTIYDGNFYESCFSWKISIMWYFIMWQVEAGQQRALPRELDWLYINK